MDDFHQSRPDGLMRGAARLEVVQSEHRLDGMGWLPLAQANETSAMLVSADRGLG